MHKLTLTPEAISTSSANPNIISFNQERVYCHNAFCLIYEFDLNSYSMSCFAAFTHLSIPSLRLTIGFQLVLLIILEQFNKRLDGSDFLAGRSKHILY